MINLSAGCNANVHPRLVNCMPVVIAMTGGLDAVAKQRPTCVPCPPVLRTTDYGLNHAYQPRLSSAMSKFFDKAAQKVKMKVDRVVDRLRPSSRQESRAGSSVPLQQHEHSNIPAPAVKPQAASGMANEVVCVCDKTCTAHPAHASHHRKAP